MIMPLSVIQPLATINNILWNIHRDFGDFENDYWSLWVSEIG